MMSKFFATLLIVLSLCTTVFSQTKGETEFGFHVGYNAATVTSDDNITNSKYRSGFNAGVSVDYFFSDRWSIKGELTYDQKGWNNGYFDSGSGPVTTNYHLDYLTIPVMANWHFGRTRNWYLNFGPYVGVLLSASETARDTDIKSILSSTDFGLDAGIGVKIPVSEKTKFFIELNGQSGFTDLVKDNTGMTIRSSTSNINIGFNF
ncbi:porin family protein [Arcticibacter tournemirensis]